MIRCGGVVCWIRHAYGAVLIAGIRLNHFRAALVDSHAEDRATCTNIQRSLAMLCSAVPRAGKKRPSSVKEPFKRV